MSADLKRLRELVDNIYDNSNLIKFEDERLINASIEVLEFVHSHIVVDS